MKSQNGGLKSQALMFKGRLESILATWMVYHFIVSVIRLSQHLDSPWYIRIFYKWKMWSFGELLTVVMSLKHS
jgi:hypothetical protein